MRTIVAVLHPAIFATLAMGTPALSIRDTAVCLRSWKRQGRGLISDVPYGSAFSIGAALSFAASHASLILPIGLEGSESYALALYLSPALRGEDVVLRLPQREVSRPEAQGGHCTLI